MKYNDVHINELRILVKEHVTNTTVGGLLRSFSNPLHRREFHLPDLPQILELDDVTQLYTLIDILTDMKNKIQELLK